MKQIGDYYFSCFSGSETSTNLPVVLADDLDEVSFYRNWVDKNMACLVKGAVTHWPAVAKCKRREYWLNNFDNFGLSVYPHHNHIKNDVQQKDRIEMNFHDAIERLFADTDPIVNMPAKEIMDPRGRYSAELRGFKDDLGGFSFLPNPPLPRIYSRLRCFLYRRAATAWHWHNIDETLMCQVNGPKRVGLINSHLQHPEKVVKFLMSESYLEGAKLDPSIRVKPYIVTVEEGDALYIPPYWFHAVVPGDDNIGLTAAFCWRSPVHIFGNFSNYFVRDVYRRMYQPISRWSYIAPFLGICAGTSYALKRISGKI